MIFEPVAALAPVDVDVDVDNNVAVASRRGEKSN
jgi:hypothetical protein